MADQQEERSKHACPLCRGDGEVRDHGAVRIDTLRNRLAAMLGLVQDVAEELEDLHVLAYERPRTVVEERVSGGGRDYCLDNHGDPRARDAFKHLNAATIEASDMLAVAVHDTLRLLRAGDERTPNTQRRIQRADLAEHIAHQADRIQRGDYTPLRRLPQPDTAEAIKAAQKETEKHQREFKGMRRLARWLWEHRNDPKKKPIPHDLLAIATNELYPAKAKKVG